MTNDLSRRHKYKEEDVDLPLRMEGRWMDSIYVFVFIRRLRDQDDKLPLLDTLGRYWLLIQQTLILALALKKRERKQIEFARGIPP